MKDERPEGGGNVALLAPAAAAYAPRRASVVPSTAAEQPRRKKQEGPQQFEYGLHPNPQNPERNRNEPDQRPQQQHQQREWPADDEEHEPKQYSHTVTLILSPHRRNPTHRRISTPQRTHLTPRAQRSEIAALTRAFQAIYRRAPVRNAPRADARDALRLRGALRLRDELRLRDALRLRGALGLRGNAGLLRVTRAYTRNTRHYAARRRPPPRRPKLVSAKTKHARRRPGDHLASQSRHLASARRVKGATSHHRRMLIPQRPNGLLLVNRNVNPHPPRLSSQADRLRRTSQTALLAPNKKRTRTQL